MTTIIELQKIISYVQSLTNREEKIKYLESWDRNTLNFLGSNIRKDGIAKTTANEIPISDKSISDMESITKIFGEASKLSRKKDKIRLMKTIRLSKSDREFVLTCLFESLKLGLKIPIPDPIFGETIQPQLCGTGIIFNPQINIIEEKFDGIRCIVTNNNGEIIIQSRNGKILDVPIIKQHIKNILPKGSTVDGEIVATDGQFESLDRKSNNLIYKIFDIIFYDNEKIEYGLNFRKDFIKRYIIENDHIQISKKLNLNSIEEIDNWIIQNDAEGIVAKEPNSIYKYNNRKDWIKYKHYCDISGLIISYNLGEGRRENMIGAVEFLPDGFKETTFVGSGFTDEKLIQMKELLDNNNKIRIDVKYQNLTLNDRALRFPIFLKIREINGEEI